MIGRQVPGRVEYAPRELLSEYDRFNVHRQGLTCNELRNRSQSWKKKTMGNRSEEANFFEGEEDKGRNWNHLVVS